MGLRFFRRRQLFRALRVNVSKSGPSVSVGVCGAHVTVGRRGVTRTVGIPGTGVFYTSRSGRHADVHTVQAGRTAEQRALGQHQDPQR
jgi:Protein of unknown function (DUF4236)